MQDSGSAPFAGKKIRSRRTVGLFFMFFFIVFLSAIFYSDCLAHPQLLGITTIGSLPNEYVGSFSQNDITFWDPCGEKSEDSGAECTTPSGDKITWLGDTDTVKAKSLIEQELSGVDIRTKEAGDPSGLDLLREVVSANQLRPYLVLAFGADDNSSEAETTKALEEIAKLVGDKSKVILTTAYSRKGRHKNSNAAKKSYASSHDNFHVADWSADAKQDYYKEDGAYIDDKEGQKSWINTIVKTLPKDCSSGLLPGNDAPEKIWNWFYEYLSKKNLSNVNLSALISGIMGNIQAESNFNPFALNSDGCSGLWQRCGSEGQRLMQEVNNALGKDYFGNPSEEAMSGQNLDKAIDVELKFLSQDMEHGPAGENFFEALSSWGVADTPRGYSDLFLAVIERAVGGSDSLEDPGVKNHHSESYQSGEERRQHADEIFNKYSSQAGSNNSSSQAKSVSSSSDGYSAGSDACECQETSGENVNVTGGLNEEQAQKLADFYNAPSTPLGTGYYLDRKENCVAFSGWSLANLTDLSGGQNINITQGDGADVATNLASRFNLPNDTTPKPWSIFSSTIFHGDNHTGLVVGIEGNQLITVEAEFWSETTGSLARVRKDPIPNGSTTYTHLDGHLNDKRISEIIGSAISTSTSNSGSSSGSGSSSSTNTNSNKTKSNPISWDSAGWITGGMNGYNKEPAPDLGTEYQSKKPNKILLHYTQGTTNGLAAYGEGPGIAAHFTIDLKKKEVYQHQPISKPSGAVIDSDDVRDIVQIEIVGYGFYEGNPDNPGPDSKCIVPGGGDFTSSEYCFAKFSDEDWDYLATLMVGISKWGEENGASIPLTSSVTWTGNVNNLRLSPQEFNSTTGVVAHMHAPDKGNNRDTGNIWPLVKAAIDRQACDTDSDESSISGAKNADKQAEEIGKITFSDDDKASMKTLLENYGDLAYRTGKTYNVPWIAILVQARYEDGSVSPNQWCGKNNAWGINCFGGNVGPGKATNYANLGEGFTGYGETAHNGNFNEALKYPDDPVKYIQALQGPWIGTGNKYNLESSIQALQKFVDSPEGQAIVAQFGAANCNMCNDTGSSGDVLASVQYIIDLANKNGSTYVFGGGHGSDPAMFDSMLNGAPVNVDCTGFASMVMYKTYGQMTSFDGDSIFKDPLYVEVPRAQVRPGDVFAYDSHEHGGIVVEASNGVVTKIAHTGGSEGRSGGNNNIGYESGKDSYTIGVINNNGHFFRWKGASK